MFPHVQFYKRQNKNETQMTVLKLREQEGLRQEQRQDSGPGLPALSAQGPDREIRVASLAVLGCHPFVPGGGGGDGESSRPDWPLPHQACQSRPSQLG